MVRFYFLFVVFLIGIFWESFAQRYEPMVVEDAHWIGAIEEPGNPLPIIKFYEEYIRGDSMVNGVAYKKVYTRPMKAVNKNKRAPFQPTDSVSTQVALLREDTVARKVYAIIALDQFGRSLRFDLCPKEEILLYDFSKIKGDTISACLVGGGEISVDTVYKEEGPFRIRSGGDLIEEFDSLYRWNLDESGTVYYEALGGFGGLLREFANLGATYWLQHYCRGSNCDSIIDQTLDPTISIEAKLEEKNWKAFPNPAKNKITLAYSGNKTTPSIHFHIFDIAGKEVLREIHSIISRKEIEMDISSLSGGVYFLEIFDGEQFIRKKILIKR